MTHSVIHQIKTWKAIVTNSDLLSTCNQNQMSDEEIKSSRMHSTRTSNSFVYYYINDMIISTAPTRIIVNPYFKRMVGVCEDAITRRSSELGRFLGSVNYCNHCICHSSAIHVQISEICRDMKMNDKPKNIYRIYDRELLAIYEIICFLSISWKRVCLPAKHTKSSFCNLPLIVPLKCPFNYHAGKK